jgi:hypothetical protein
VAFYRSEKRGGLPLDEAIERATRTIDGSRADEVFERVLTQSAESTDFHDLHELWTHSPKDAEFVWWEMKREAEREFMTGHLAATVFEPVDWMRSAWKRAQFLGVRDSFIDEYQPEGGVEVALVDTMAQAYFLQLHWTEEAVKRTKADPRRHSYEHAQWQRYRREAANRADVGRGLLGNPLRVGGGVSGAGGADGRPLLPPLPAERSTARQPPPLEGEAEAAGNPLNPRLGGEA